MTTKAESVMAAARELLANPSDDLNDAVDGEGGYCLTPRGWAERCLRAALALPDAPHESERPDAPAPAAGERERAVVKAARELDAAWGPGVLAPLPAALRAALAMPETPHASCDLADLARRLCDAVDRIPWGDISRGGGTSSIESAQAASHRLRDALATHPPTDAAACAHGVRLDHHARACVVCKQPSRDAAAAERGQDAFEAFEALRTLCDEIGALPDVGASMIPMRIDEVVAEVRRLRTDAAAAERAEIVAMLRESADGYQAAALHPTALALRGAADRIAARGPGPVWTEDRVRKLAEAVRDKAADLCCFPISGTRGSLAREVDAIDLDALMRAMRAGT